MQIDFERCATAFYSRKCLDEMPGQTVPFITETYSLALTQTISDRKLLEKVTSLLERTLAHAHYVPKEESLTRLKAGVEAFLKKSEECSLEKRAQDFELALECSYLQEALLQRAFGEKLGFQRLIEQHVVATKTRPSITLWLGREITAFRPQEVEWLHDMQKALYLVQRFIASMVEHRRLKNAYFCQFTQLVAEGKVTLGIHPAKEAPNGFWIEYDYGALFTDPDSLAILLKTHRLVQEVQRRGSDDGMLLKYVQFLVKLKNSNTASKEVVDGCLSALRCWYLSKNSPDAQNPEGPHEEPIYWNSAFEIACNTTSVTEPRFARAISLGLSTRAFLLIENQIDQFFCEKQEIAVAKNEIDNAVKVLSWHDQRQSLPWLMTTNFIDAASEDIQKMTTLYGELDNTVRAFVDRLPRYEKDKKRGKNRNVKLIAERLLLSKLDIRPADGMEKARTFRDLSFDAYAARTKTILAYAEPVVTQIDALVNIATMLLREEEGEKTKVEKVAHKIESLSIASSPSPKKKKVRQPRQQPILQNLEEPSLTPLLPHFCFHYHERVTRWWDPAKDPLRHDHTYAHAATFPPKEQLWKRAQHNFALIVDEFAESEGIRHENQLSLVGEMTIGDETKRGLFVYAFDKNNVCYHRYFTVRATSDIVNEYVRQGFFYDIDFPQLPKAKGASPKVIHISEDESTVQDIGTLIIVIDDKKNRATIKLCRLSVNAVGV